MCNGVVTDPAVMSPAERVDALAHAERQIARWHGFQYRVMAAMHADSRPSVPGEDDKAWVREDIACALRLSPSAASDRLGDALMLTNRLCQTLTLLERGEISGLQARVLVEATVSLEGPEVAAVQARVLPSAPDQSVGTFRRAVHRAVLACAPRSVEQTRAHDVSERRVCLRPSGVGTSELWALLPDEGAAALMAAVTALARRTEPSDRRTSDQRRADALVQLGLDALAGETGGRPPVEQRMRPTVNVTVALSTLLALDEQPGELDNVGPIPAGLARRLADDPSGTWRRLVTDDHGRLLDYGRSTYRPPTALADHVIARDRTCRFPHCTRAARRCDLDHRIRWTDGGTTSEANLHTLCRRHHRAKDEFGWAAAFTDDNHTTWTSPTGHTYIRPSAAYPLHATYPLDTDTDPDPPPF
jgi:hypothetical protein